MWQRWLTLDNDNLFIFLLLVAFIVHLLSMASSQVTHTLPPISIGHVLRHLLCLYETWYLTQITYFSPPLLPHSGLNIYIYMHTRFIYQKMCTKRSPTPILWMHWQGMSGYRKVPNFLKLSRFVGHLKSSIEQFFACAHFRFFRVKTPHKD